MQLMILLSTYNGEKYLREQLNSILQQTLACDLCLIRDDGSTDSTLQILHDYCNQYTQIQLLDDTQGHIGINSSYSLLLRYSLTLNANYIMFADQDDIWFPEKSKKLMAAMTSLNKNKPALIFTDAKLIDDRFALISPSFAQFQKTAPTNTHSLKALLLYTPALGCSMIFNHHLLKLITPLAEKYPNPDKWLLITAISACSQIKYIAEPTLFYRQHAQNLTGAFKGIQRKIFNLSNIQFLKTRYQTAINEARLIEKNIAGLSQKDKIIIQQFITLFTGNYLMRILNYFRFCLIPPHWSRKTGLLLSLFFKYK